MVRSRGRRAPARGLGYSGTMGEFELLAKLRERLPAPGSRVRLGSGDDAAITVPGGATATSVDAIVDGVHFDRSRASAGPDRAQGAGDARSRTWRRWAPSRARPTSSSAPRRTSARPSCSRSSTGCWASPRATGTTLAGGDLTRAPALTLALTVVGHAPSPERFVTRGGAEPGRRPRAHRRARRGRRRPAPARGAGARRRARRLDSRRAAPAPARAGAAARRRPGAGRGRRKGDDRPQRRPRRRRRPPGRAQRRRPAHRGGGAAARRRASRSSPPRPAASRSSWPSAEARTTSCWRRWRRSGSRRRGRRSERRG